MQNLKIRTASNRIKLKILLYNFLNKIWSSSHIRLYRIQVMVECSRKFSSGFRIECLHLFSFCVRICQCTVYLNSNYCKLTYCSALHPKRTCYEVIIQFGDRFSYPKWLSIKSWTRGWRWLFLGRHPFPRLKLPLLAQRFQKSSSVVDEMMEKEAVKASSVRGKWKALILYLMLKIATPCILK